MNWPDPWPTTDEGVRQWRITDPYDRFFQNRVNVITELFERDPYSIDGTALAVVALSALAERRFADETGPRVGKDRRRFRMLLTEHCRSFENRMCIPEIVRLARRNHRWTQFEQPILQRFPIEGGMRMRRLDEDPTVAEFNAWADEQSTPIENGLREHDYAGCIFRLYRNSVVHELRPANGREGFYPGPDPSERPIFYSNHAGVQIGGVDKRDPVEYMRFGIYPPYLLDLLREAIASLREWALANDQDLFTDEDDEDA